MQGDKNEVLQLIAEEVGRISVFFLARSVFLVCLVLKNTRYRSSSHCLLKRSCIRYYTQTRLYRRGKAVVAIWTAAGGGGNVGEAEIGQKTGLANIGCQTKRGRD